MQEGRVEGGSPARTAVGVVATAALVVRERLVHGVSSAGRGRRGHHGGRRRGRLREDPPSRAAAVKAEAEPGLVEASHRVPGQVSSWGKEPLRLLHARQVSVVRGKVALVSCVPQEEAVSARLVLLLLLLLVRLVQGVWLLVLVFRCPCWAADLAVIVLLLVLQAQSLVVGGGLVLLLVRRVRVLEDLLLLLLLPNVR